MQQTQIEIPSGLHYAGLGIRFLAILLDILLLVAVGFPIILLFQHIQSMGALFVILSATLGFLVYFIVMEAVLGASVGKLLLGLLVIKTDGSPIGWREAILRNLLYILDGFIGGLIGAIAIAISPLHQRLGDQVAGTVVVRRRS